MPEDFKQDNFRQRQETDDDKFKSDIPDPEEVYNPKYHKKNSGYDNIGIYPDNEERNMSMLTHLAGFAMYIFPAAGNIIGPLLVWLSQKDKSEFINQHGKAALNFQISFTIYYTITALLALFSFGILFFLPGIVWIFHTIYMILMAIKAKNGEETSCPFSFPFLK
ncbi:MAG: DUF4870 domain-containing protein [Candidatus Coatesbacteria bacterium]|nr:DUF4870 domain-containing protein [Candidatus Coatesbacteria bacterium]